MNQLSVAEYQIISKVLADKDFGVITDNFITEDYFYQVKAEFKYIKDFVDKYRCVPDKETFTEQFPKFEYLMVGQSVRSIVDDLREQHLFQKAVKVLNDSSSLFEKDANEGATYLLNHLEELEPTYEFSCTDMVHDRHRLEEYKRLLNNEDDNYIALPLEELNAKLYGFKRGEELFLWQAKSSTGKSQLLALCIESASKQGYRVGVISPEMSKDALAQRALDVARGHFSSSALQKGLLVPGYEEHINELCNSDEHVFMADIGDFGSSLTVNACRNFVKSKKLDILFIDGLVYITPDKIIKGMSRADMLGEVARELLALSNEFKIPVNGVVQSRRRGNKDKRDGEDIDDGEDIALSYEVIQTATRVVTINRVASAIKLFIAKNRYGQDDNGGGKGLLYSYDFDRLTLTFIPQLEDLKEEEVEEMKEVGKHVF